MQRAAIITFVTALGARACRARGVELEAVGGAAN
jgi:hypothetical protein